jgi:hypothetical protein
MSMNIRRSTPWMAATLVGFFALSSAADANGNMRSTPAPRPQSQRPVHHPSLSRPVPVAPVYRDPYRYRAVPRVFDVYRNGVRYGSYFSIDEANGVARSVSMYQGGTVTVVPFTYPFSDD